MQLALKFGKQWAKDFPVIAEGKASPRVVKMLSIQPPTSKDIVEALMGVAEEYDVEWSPKVQAPDEEKTADTDPNRLGAIVSLADQADDTKDQEETAEEAVANLEAMLSSMPSPGGTITSGKTPGTGPAAATESLMTQLDIERRLEAMERPNLTSVSTQNADSVAGYGGGHQLNNASSYGGVQDIGGGYGGQQHSSTTSSILSASRKEGEQGDGEGEAKEIDASAMADSTEVLEDTDQPGESSAGRIGEESKNAGDAGKMEIGVVQTYCA